MYSTGMGRICPGCGWPVRDCTCSAHGADRSVPERPGRIVAQLRMEKKGRDGKTITVVDGLPANAAFLKALCRELKRACGTGGTAAGGSVGAVELQGDLRDRVRECLLKKGFVVKG